MTERPPEQHPFRPARTGIGGLPELEERRILDFIEGIVRRTALWRSEQNDVRLELLNHFDDGIDASHSVDKLLQDFGSPRVAARLIRKAKLRSRPWQWHVWRRSVQLALASVSVAILGFVFLVVRLHLMSPAPRVDFLRQVDEVVAELPEAERAWPDYRAGLIALGPYRNPQPGFNGIYLSTQGKADPYWKNTVAFLDAHPKAIDLMLQGSTKRRLGFVFRDRGNDPWLLQNGFQSSAQLYPDNQLARVKENHTFGALNYVHLIFYSSAVRAMESGNLPEFKRFWQAYVNAARQEMQEQDTFPRPDIGRYQQVVALRLLRRLISQHAGLLSDADLRAWRDAASPERWKSPFTVNGAFRFQMQELLQNGYSESSTGDGRITLAGCELLRQRLMQISRERRAKMPALATELHLAGVRFSSTGNIERTMLTGTQEEASALRWSASLANRQEMQDEFDRLLKLLDTEAAAPFLKRPSQAQSAYDREYRQIAETRTHFGRYWPVLLILPEHASWLFEHPPNDEVMQMNCEATSTTIALEQYRRRTGNWPATLEQLVPLELATVPSDIYRAAPLVYRLVDGNPLLYSIGNDLDDDEGISTFKLPQETSASHNGDLPFLPPEE